MRAPARGSGKTGGPGGAAVVSEGRAASRRFDSCRRCALVLVIGRGQPVIQPCPLTHTPPTTPQLLSPLAAPVAAAAPEPARTEAKEEQPAAAPTAESVFAVRDGMGRTG